MKSSMRAIALAIAALGFSTASAFAACAPAVTPVTDGISIDVTGCHLQLQGPQVLPVTPGTEVVIRDPATGEIASDGGSIVTGIAAQGVAIGALQTNDGLQDIAIASQGAAIATHTTQIAGHETRITATETVNASQQTTIDTHTTQIAAGVAHDVVQDAAIGSLETVTAGHEVRLDAHDALLSQHAATLVDHENRLDSQEKGLAIAMAMPDTWLSDKQSFAIAGGVGGFGDEIAVGFAMIGRIDEHWSINGGLGGDISMKEYGWKAGLRAGW